ncbi:MFS transporter [Amycolatopsis minnesotensis]|uniref:MFS transporter n=1 Tax=Amycolatopsis minnesotensis TaxID=337894 RepID=A0ABN2SX32_9PSEU
MRRLWAAVLCGYLALGATLQELPGYLTGTFAAGPAITGLTVGAAFAATAVTRPFAGRAGDAGLARLVVMTGGALTAVAALGHLLAGNVVVLLVARLVMGAGEGALFSAALPWVLSRAPAGLRGRVTGWFGLSMWGGLACGPLLAVGFHELGGSTAVWWLVLALPLASTALVATTPRATGERTRLRPTSWRDLVPRGVGATGTCLGFAAYGYGTLTALLVLHLTVDGIGGENLGLAVFSVAFLVVRAAGSPLVDRLGGVRVAQAVLVVEAAGLVLLATAATSAVALAGAAVTGAGLSLIFPSTATVTLGRTGALRPGVAVGAITSCWDLGILAAGPLGGLVADRYGYRPAFLVAAGVALAAFALTATLTVPGRTGRRSGVSR